MSTPPVTFRWQNSELYVIPARHFCHVFADRLNRICSNPATMPEAIAVELGPETVATALSWLAELGVGTPGYRLFPVMLALVKRNRTIRTSLREKALRLQRESGKDISELSPEILRRELGFSAYSVLFLSPIDSIIEGLRCGLELGVPVQGVDLEETADGIYESALIEDPQLAGEDMGSYMVRNLPIAETYRDEEIDSRREMVMAARLKALLARHKRVAFTCGMAHWLKIRTLLLDDSVRPAVFDGTVAAKAGHFKRVVVHPEIAARHMDLFPAVVRAYEKRRRPVPHAPDSASRRRLIDTEALYQKNQSRAYKKYFSCKDQSLSSVGYDPDPGSIRSFEDYLRNLCRLRHCRVPDLFMTVQAVQDVIGGEFAKTLASAFMEFPWTLPEKHADCALLSPSTDSATNAGSAVLVEDGFGSGKHIFVRSIPANPESSTGTQIPYEWHKPKKNGSSSTLHAWHPWNCLISSMSYQAFKEGLKKNRKKNAVLFEGSLLDGIDVKSTIRAFSRGNEQIYVRDSVYETLPGSPSPLEGFPVVWILSPGKHPNASWNALHEPSNYMDPYIRDRAEFKRIRKSRGSQMVVVIAYGNSDYSQRGVKIDRFYGILLFQPISWSNREFARWAELTRYRRNPFCRDAYLGPRGGGDLTNFYAGEHNIKVGENDWATSLILMALPFTRNVLTVVIPDGYRIDKYVFEKAKSYGVKVVATSARLFSPENVARLSICHLVPAISTDPVCVYSKKVEKAIGEPQSAYGHLVPPELAAFGGGI